MATDHNKFEYEIGARIKHFRELKNLSTNRLANMAGISQSYLRDIELENKNPSIEVIYQLCKALGVSLPEFFSDETNLFEEDPLLKSIFKLNPDQREALLAFLQMITL